MNIFTVASNRVGVGKTTTVVNIGCALAARGHSVLLIETDAQGNLSQSFPLEPAHFDMAHVLQGKVPLASIVQQVGENLYLAPGSSALLETEKHLAAEPGGAMVLREVLSIFQGVDYVIIDTPPGLGLLTQAALTAADVVLIPVQPEYYGLEGLAALVSTCHQIRRRMNPGLRIGGVFFTRYNRADKRRVLRDMMALLEGHVDLGPLIMEQTIRENVAVKQAQALKVNLLTEYPDSAGAVDYIVLTSAILMRL